MAGKNKFGFDPVDAGSVPSRRERRPGPMGAAVREAAESLTETTEAKVEQRKKNAVDAKAYREAQEEGRVLATLSLEEIHTDALPRDRLELEAVASSDEMEELKASIRARGQREPVEVFVDEAGRHQLKKGWRRFTALGQLLAETGDAQFGQIVARVATGETRLARYVDMIEENIIREDLSFAEMANLAIVAAADGDVEGGDAEAMVTTLYASLHKMKRSYIRSFVFLLSEIGEALPWPKAISRNLGVDVARALKAGQGARDQLLADLAACGDAEAQNAALAAFVAAKPAAAPAPSQPSEPKRKFEFHIGATKVTARKGECRIVSGADFSAVPREVLEEAVVAFEKVVARK